MKNNPLSFLLFAILLSSISLRVTALGDGTIEKVYGIPAIDKVIDDIRKENVENQKKGLPEYGWDEIWKRSPAKDLATLQRRQIESGISEMAHQDANGIWSFQNSPNKKWVVSYPQPHLSRPLDWSNLKSAKEVLLFSKTMPEPFQDEVLLEIKKAFSFAQDEALKLQLAALLYRYGKTEGKQYLQSICHKSLLAAEILARGGEALEFSTANFLAKAASKHNRGNCFLYALGKNPSEAAEQVLWRDLINADRTRTRVYLGALVLRPRKMTPEHLRHMVARVKIGQENSTQLEYSLYASAIVLASDCKSIKERILCKKRIGDVLSGKIPVEYASDYGTAMDAAIFSGDDELISEAMAIGQGKNRLNLPPAQAACLSLEDHKENMVEMLVELRHKGYFPTLLNEVKVLGLACKKPGSVRYKNLSAFEARLRQAATIADSSADKKQFLDLSKDIVRVEDTVDGWDKFLAQMYIYHHDLKEIPAELAPQRAHQLRPNSFPFLRPEEGLGWVDIKNKGPVKQ